MRRVIDRLGDGRFDYDDGQRRARSAWSDHASIAAARSAMVDFTGTGAQNDGNFNAPAGGDARRGAVRVPLLWSATTSR